MTERPTDRQADRPTDRAGHREVTLSISKLVIMYKFNCNVIFRSGKDFETVYYDFTFRGPVLSMTQVSAQRGSRRRTMTMILLTKSRW